MSTKLTSQVINLTSKKTNPNAKGKVFTIWHLELDTGEKVNCGFTKPNVTIGDTYTFMIDSDQYGLKLKSVLNADTSEPASDPKPKATPAKPAAQQNAWTFPIGPKDYNRSVCRREAVRDAIQMLSHNSSSPYGEVDVQRVIEVAKVFEAYTTGDSDIEDVLKLHNEYYKLSQGVIINDKEQQEDY